MSEKLDLKTAATIADALEHTAHTETDGSLEGLTEKQALALRLRMRGMTLKAIGQALGGVSAPYVHKILKEVREIQGKKATERSVSEHVADAVSVYEEVEQEALSMMNADKIDPGTRLRAMSIVLAARDKHVKLLMDLGFMERAAQKTTTDHRVVVLQNWEDNLKRQLSATIIESQLAPLEDPVPLLEDGSTEMKVPEKRKHYNEEEHLAELVGDIEFEDDEDDDE